jgi:hypothetical protein
MHKKTFKYYHIFDAAEGNGIGLIEDWETLEVSIMLLDNACKRMGNI